MKRFVAALAVLVFLAGVLGAQAIQIRVLGDRFSFDEQPEGALLLPRSHGSPSEVLRGHVPAKSADGTVQYTLGGKYSGVWNISQSVPGRYDFFLASRMKGPEHVWSSRTTVELSVGGSTRTWTAPEGTGAVWYVFSLIGGSNEIINANMILQDMRLLYGTVRQATTGKPFPGAMVRLYARSNKALLASTETDEDGFYLLTPPKDGLRFDLEITGKDCIAVKETIDYLKEDYPRRIDAAITGFLKNAQYRFVLTWGNSPRDLDAHLTGPDTTGSSFHLSFHNMKSWSKRHFLDVDDMDGYGPETITLTRLDPGIYEFWVNDWSNQTNPLSGGLAGSDAVVRLYRETELLQEFTVPVKSLGTCWKVCTLDGSTGLVTIDDRMLPSLQN